MYDIDIFVCYMIAAARLWACLVHAGRCGYHRSSMIPAGMGISYCRALMMAVARYKESKALLQVSDSDLWSMVWGTDEQRPFDSMECDVCSAARA